MKWLRRILDRQAEKFAPDADGNRPRLWPLFNALDHFMFAPSTRTAHAPHVRDPLDVKRYMSVVIIAVTPCIAMAVYFFGLRMLLMILVSYAAGGAVEVLFALVRREEINEGFLVTGMLFPLILPASLPLWMVAAGVIFGVLVGKELFGGTGRNLFNAALVGRCFLTLSYPTQMSAQWVQPVLAWPGRLTTFSVDIVSAATPLAAAGRGEYASLSDLFIGNVLGSAGETSALAILIGGAILLASRVANWRSVVGVLGSFAVLGGLLQWIAPQHFGPVHWHLLAGGLLFGTFFMVTDPVTGPITRGGKWAFGVIIGVTTLLIRNIASLAEGMMFAILLGNIAAPLLDEVAIRLRIRSLRNER